MNVAVKECVAEQLSKSEINHIKKKSEYEGKVFKTNNYGNVVVLQYTNTRDVTVKFINTGNTRKVGISELKKGEVRDNELKPVYKVGIMDIPNAMKRGPKPKSYNTWNNMLQRCYNEHMRSKLPTYSDCEVSDDFKYYSKFKEWAEKQVGYDQKGWCLDKDILVKGNKTYSAETCCFIPQEINCLITGANAIRGVYPIGVYHDTSKCKKRFSARVSKNGKHKRFGSYETPEEAFEVYKREKESYIKEVANKWKDHIDPRVYKALYEWTINIDD